MTCLAFSRRRFLTTTAAAAAATRFYRPALHAQEIPDVLARGRAAGATAKVKVQSLRGNVTALMGVGGNIAVLPGKDGKLLIDSGYMTARPQLTEALWLPSVPIRSLISSTPTGTSITPTATNGSTPPAPPSSPTKTAAPASAPRRRSSPTRRSSHRRPLEPSPLWSSRRMTRSS